MKRKSIVLLVVLVVLQLCSNLWARPTTAYEAEMVVKGWLKADSNPLGTPLGQQVIYVETFTNEYGKAVYYIAYLQPSGFVIVSADDLIEPIIGFADDGTYDPSTENPLGALVTNDLNGRIEAVQTTLSILSITTNAVSTENRNKWQQYKSFAETSEDVTDIMRRESISDVRIAPLVQSKWAQNDVCGKACYNYFTPPGDPCNPVNYPSGCVATAMAQLMRYHRYPTESNDKDPDNPSVSRRFKITVKDMPNWPEAELLGVEYKEGPYDYNNMTLVPDCNTSDVQRRAIGTLCHDAGVAIKTTYGLRGSSASLFDTRNSLVSIFSYDNASYGQSGGLNIGPGLIGMINPNLDANCPVILGIKAKEGIHAIVCDGYGYESLRMYHHLNLGWSGTDNCWYNLPGIDCGYYKYSSAVKCVYNIFISGMGEIISGRVLDLNGGPSHSKVVCLEYEGNIIKTCETNANGIFAFANVESNSTYTIWVEGSDFPSREVTTGASINYSPISGNRWGVNFPSSPGAEILYVDINAISGSNNGSCWADAFIDLQDAIDVAVNSGGEVKEIWVANGIYKPDRGTGLRTLSFQLIDGVGIYGGFAGGDSITYPGGESEREQRHPAVNLAILSGDLNSDDEPNFVNNYENSYHIVNCNGTGQTAILDGFVITGGHASGLSLNHNPFDQDNYGGGIYIFKGSPTLKNCKLINNTAGQYGGGIYCSSSNPTIYNCVVSGNRAVVGGGMRNYYSGPILTNCILSGNLADEGGGMYNYESHPIVTNCTFSGNYAKEGAGINNYSDSIPKLTNCILWGNIGEQISGTATVSYSAVQDLNTNDEQIHTGTGNTDDDPLFVLMGYWSHINDPYSSVVEPNDPNAVWIDGDYRLKSHGGRWNPGSQTWVIDDVTSPCIDAGDPNNPIADEPSPNGDIVNMGAYGGTSEASKSPEQ